MAHEHTEIEIKLPVENTDEVREFLNTHATPISQNDVQKDTYYVPSHRNFLHVQFPYEWLRLRETAQKTSITYKHYYPENEEHTYCTEYETSIAEGESMKKIFAALDIHEVVVVEKSRTTWMYETVEVVLDEVKELGSFIELGATTPFPSPQEARTYLHSVVQKMKVKIGKEDTRGYPYRLLEKKGYVFGKT